MSSAASRACGSVSASHSRLTGRVVGTSLQAELPRPSDTAHVPQRGSDEVGRHPDALLGRRLNQWLESPLQESAYLVHDRNCGARSASAVTRLASCSMSSPTAISGAAASCSTQRTSSSMGTALYDPDLERRFSITAETTVASSFPKVSPCTPAIGKD